jgi:hypothetical protein
MKVQHQERKKAIITVCALYQRLNRRLKRDGEQLRTARGERAKEQLGRFYVVETGHHVRPENAVSAGLVYSDVNLEKLAVKLGVIQPWEQVEGDAK